MGFSENTGKSGGDSAEMGRVSPRTKAASFTAKSHHSYCASMEWSNHWEAVARSTKGQIAAFLVFILDHGRVGKHSSISQYLRQWRMLYSRVTGKWLDRNVSRELSQVSVPGSTLLRAIGLMEALVHV